MMTHAPHKRALSIIGNMSATVADELIPYAIGSTYSFATGIATITAVAAVVNQYLVFFALQSALAIAITSPVALITGGVFAYLHHIDYQKKERALALIKAEIAELIKMNEDQGKKFQSFVEANLENHKKYSFSFGAFIYKRPSYKNKQGLSEKMFDMTTRFVLDAGLTIGVGAFILSTFTSISIVGFPFSLIIVGGLVMATLTARFIHLKKMRYQAQMIFYEKEKQRQSNINNWYAHELEPSQQKKETDKGDWWDVDAATQGAIKAMLTEIQVSVREYLYSKVIFSCADYAKGEQKSQYPIFGKNLTETDFYNKANRQTGYFNKNILTAIKIELLIEKFGSDTDRLVSLLKLINQMRKDARNYSPFSLFGSGDSRLADQLDAIFQQADDLVMQKMKAEKDFSKKEISAFEVELKQKMDVRSKVIPEPTATPSPQRKNLGVAIKF